MQPGPLSRCRRLSSPSLDLMLAHYVTHSVSMINECSISWIIQHNADCITPTIQARSLKKILWIFFFSCRERISNLSLASHIRERGEKHNSEREAWKGKCARSEWRRPESSRTQKWRFIFQKLWWITTVVENGSLAFQGLRDTRDEICQLLPKSGL